jgi:hypothetical protein
MASLVSGIKRLLSGGDGAHGNKHDSNEAPVAMDISSPSNFQRFHISFIPVHELIQSESKLQKNTIRS